MDDSDDDEPPALVDLAPAAPPDLVDDNPTTTTTTTTETTIDTNLAVNNNNLNEDSSSSSNISPPCPVTILSGFLGSGKTTLIQYILRDPNHGKRIAVIENEFGDGLAVESLIARDGVNNSLQDLIELPNGCICCTVKDSLVATLENLVSKKSDLDYIIIEASGMANPGPIASVFWLDDALESRLQLDGIVTLVDAHHILQQLETTEEAAQQIAYADRILINKMDLVNSSSNSNNNTGGGSGGDGNNNLETIKATIRQLHPSAPFQCTTYSQVPDLDWILGAHCFGGAKRLEELDSLFHNIQTSIESHSHDHDHDHGHDHHDGEDCQICKPVINVGHSHTAAVGTIALEHVGSVNLSKLNKWLADILWPDQDQTNKVLTAMLHETANETENSNADANTTTTTTTTTTPVSSTASIAATRKKTPSTQIFRIKGIASVKVDDGTVDIDADADTDAVTSEAGGDSRYIDTTTLLDRRRYIIQAVHDLWEVHPASDNLQWTPDEERVCKVVIIGKGLHFEELREGFLSCFVS